MSKKCDVDYDCNFDGTLFSENHHLTVEEQICSLQTANEDIYKYVDSENEKQNLDFNNKLTEQKEILETEILRVETESKNDDIVLQGNIDSLKTYVDNQNTLQDNEEELFRNQGLFKGFLCSEEEKNNVCNVLSNISDNTIGIENIANQLNNLTVTDLNFVDGGRYPYDVGNGLNVDGGRV